MPFKFWSAPGRSCYIWTPPCWSPDCPLLPLMGLRHPAVAAARKWAGQIKRTGLAKLWRKTGNLPGFHCSNDLCSYSSSPRHPSTTQKSRSQLQHSPLLPAGCQLCTQTIRLLHTLLLLQTHQIQTSPPCTAFLPPNPHTGPSSPRHILWCIQNWRSVCFSVSFPIIVCGRAD